MCQRRVCNVWVMVACAGLFLFGSSASNADHAEKMYKPGKKGPWVYNLVVKASPHYKFREKGKLLVQGAHVPSLVEQGGKVTLFFQWFPASKESVGVFDHIAQSKLDLPGNEWSDPRALRFVGVPERVFGKRTRPMDPAAVALADGRIRLYFTLEPFGPMERVAGDARIFSAVSQDGLNFTHEEGVRFSVDKADLRDPAVAYYKGLWHMYVPNQKRNGTGFYATSTDGLTFVRQKDVRVRREGDWLGHATVCKNKVYFFGTVWRGVSSDGRKWREFDAMGTGPDPAVICLKDHSWLAATSETSGK